MRRKIVFLVVIVSLFVSSSIIEVPTVKAQYTPEGERLSYASGLSIISPSNTTYNSDALMLNVTIKRLFSPNEYDSEIMYSLDGKTNVTIPSIATFVPVSGTTESIWSTLGSYALIDGTISLPKLPQGSHFLTVYGIYKRAKGISSNYPALMQDVKTVYFTMNYGIPPTITNIQIENKTYNQNNLPINFTTDKSTSWMGYSLDGKENSTITGNTTLAGLGNGSHNLTIYANDTVGNMRNSEAVYFSIEVPEQEPLSLTLIGASASVAVIILGLIILFKKRNH